MIIKAKIWKPDQDHGESSVFGAAELCGSGSRRRYMVYRRLPSHTYYKSSYVVYLSIPCPCPYILHCTSSILCTHGLQTLHSHLPIHPPTIVMQVGQNRKRSTSTKSTQFPFMSIKSQSRSNS